VSDICDLKTLEQLSFKVVEASPDALIVINENGQIVIFNAQAEFLFGYAREEVIGQHIEILLIEDKRETHIQHRTKYFESPLVREMGAGRVLEGRRASGQAFPVQIKLAPLSPVPGVGVHALAVVRRANGGGAEVKSLTVKADTVIFHPKTGESHGEGTGR
jgi:PAS domain S-box-containing protein